MPYLLEMKDITKQFGVVKAVDNISLTLEAGQVLSLCGENGSGKSTLMKVLCGIYPVGSYQGEIIFSGETLQAKNIRETEQKRHCDYSSRIGTGETNVSAGEHVPRLRMGPFRYHGLRRHVFTLPTDAGAGQTGG